VPHDAGSSGGVGSQGLSEAGPEAGKTGVDMNKIGSTRKSALLGGSALMLVMFASQAHAQCVAGIAGNPNIPVDPTGFTAIATGASVNSLVSVLNTTSTAFFNQTNAFIGAPANPQPNQTGGGVWTRGVGGRVDTEATGVATAGVIGGPAFVGDITCNTTTRTEFAGYQAGVDLARLNVGGWNLHGGVTVGYVESDSTDRTPGAGTFTGNFQVPFVGLYGAATYGGFYVDAQVRWDFYQNNISDSANGIFNQNFDARGVAFAANVGYNHSFGNWFIEPSAGIVWSRVEVDPLNVSGTFILGNNPGIAPPGTLQIGDVESLLGRLSLRVGTTFQSGNLLLQPFFTASVFHEFEGNVVTNFTTNFASLGFGGVLPEIQAQLTTSRIGTYEQFSLGIAGLLQNTGWLGYARVDYRTGDNIEGVSVNGGLRYQFTPEQIAAVAGKGPIGKGPVLKAPPAPFVAAYNWTGLYVGGYGGTTWGDTDWTFVGAGTGVDPRFAGILAGGQVGFNYQFGAWVFGVEAEGGWSNAKGAKGCPNGLFFTCEDRLDTLWMVTGRLGYAVDRALFYVKGGYAAADVEITTSFNPATQPLLVGLITPPCASAPVLGQFGLQSTSGCAVDRASKTASGFAVGAGFEFGLTQNWSAKAEYMYYDLGTERFNLPVNGPVDVDITGNLVRVGVNYRFTGLFGR
jgi:opacity protein-like surface antigen